MRTTRALTVVTALLSASCGGDLDPGSDLDRARQPNLFGADDRMEWYAFGDSTFTDLSSRSVGAWIPEERVDVTDPTNVVIGSRGTHRAVHELCAGEAFEDQPVSASCTGVIIDEDLVATAGHCFDEENDCRELRFVTNWHYDGDGTFPTLTQDNVYSCREVLVQRVDSGMIDHAIIQLDRPVARPHRPASVRYTVEDIPIDTPVVLAGHGAGLPLKIDDGGRVVAYNALFFETTADTFGGSSGAPVMDSSGTVLGLHVRGPDDYVMDPGGMMCSITNQLDDDPGRTNGGDASHIALPIQELCSPGTSTSALCAGTAGDTICRQACDCPTGTTCEVQDGNITCVTMCSGDMECDDGFSCVAGRCRAGRGCFGGDVWDRDVCSRPVALAQTCGADEVCDTGECVPAPPGDTCALAEDLTMMNRFIPVDIVNTNYRNNYRGSCGAFGPDRVWRLTVTESTPLRVSARHMGYRIHIREGDCEDPGAEIACSLDTNRPSLEVDLEPGVYYVFLDAQLFTQMETTVDFIFGEIVQPMPDGGPGDAGVADAGPEMDDGGCGCRLAPTSTPTGLSALLALLGLAVWRRRRA